MKAKKLMLKKAQENTTSDKNNKQTNKQTTT